MSSSSQTDNSPSLSKKIGVLKQQLKNFERSLRFYWKSIKPAPTTPFGFKLYGSKAMQDGRFEPLETVLALRILPHVDAFVNVGANVGYYCCHAIQKSVPTYAFEPIDLNIRYLLKNIRINDWSDKIEVYPVALGSKTGILEIFGAGTGASLIKGWANTPDTDVLLAPILTLDNVLGHRLTDKRCFIMVDIEGAEKFMLEGASQFLNASPKPIWMIEICVHQHQSNGTSINPNLVQTFDFFFDNGYLAWTADATPRQITRDEVVAVATNNISTFGTHNYIFADTKASDKLAF
jgi:FkbM family methyltransferase